MLTATLSHFWSAPAQDTTAPEPRRKRPPPLFIGDAVQPWAGETMLLAILRQDAEEDGPADD